MNYFGANIIDKENLFMLKDDLEIFIITFNRAEKLKATLESIFNSPVKNCDIKILNNASTDNTEEVCKNAISAFYPQDGDNKNVTYIKNNKNIGASGNIIKAMEMASKKWLWIVADDDSFDWSHWDEIENALNQDYDIVHTTYTEGLRNETYPYIINEESFISTSIYNTKHITSIVLQNAYIMAYTLLPHHAIGCKVLNEKGKIYVPEHRIVIQSYGDKYNYIRMDKNGIFHRYNDFWLFSGYVGAYKLIEDEQLRDECNNVLCMGTDFWNSMKIFLEFNPRESLYNVFEILLSVSDKNKKELVELLFSKKYKKYKNFRKLTMLIFQVLIMSFLFNIFSVRKRGNKTVITILGIKISF